MKQILDIDNTTLVEECKAGDREAMSLLYTRFAPRMLHVITRYVGNKEDAHDILHDGFIAAFTRLDSLREAERVEYWLATIMKNLSLRFLQSQNVASILEEIPEEIEEDSEIDEIIDFETLESLITQLPDGYQKVFRLAVLENKSHKEISKILGIAPNSSSSQLFHAKVMLRRLIAEHKNKASLITLLLLIAFSAGIVYYLGSDRNAKVDEPLMSQAHSPSKLIENEESEPTDAGEQKDKKADKPAMTQSRSSSKVARSTALEDSSPAEDELAEDGKEESESETEYPETLPANDSRNDELLAEASTNEENMEVGIPNRKPTGQGGWSAGVSFDAGMVSFAGFGFSDMYDSSSCSPIRPPENPDDNKHPDDDQNSSDKEEENTSLKTRSASRKDLADDLKNWSHKHYLPITVGFTVEKRLGPIVGMETGLAYTYLHSDYESLDLDVACHWHYLEIPLKFNIYAYQSANFSLYGSVGGRVAIPVYSNATMHSKRNSAFPYIGSLAPKPVWSAGVSVGVSYRLSKRLNLFIEPSLQYHFPQDAKVPNIWTDDEPWSFSIPFGVRFSW